MRLPNEKFEQTLQQPCALHGSMQVEVGLAPKAAMWRVEYLELLDSSHIAGCAPTYGQRDVVWGTRGRGFESRRSDHISSAFTDP